MMPSANSAKAKSPATGRSASAACAELPIAVAPSACRVAAVGDHDGEADQHRDAHSYDRVQPDALQRRRRLLRRPQQRPAARQHALVLDLLGRLPEQQVGRERHAEDGDHRRDPGRVRGQARHQRR